MPYDVPDGPWEIVGVDLFVLERQSFLIDVDYYSGYFEVQDINSTTSTHRFEIMVFQAWNPNDLN